MFDLSCFKQMWCINIISSVNSSKSLKFSLSLTLYLPFFIFANHLPFKC